MWLLRKVITWEELSRTGDHQAPPLRVPDQLDLVHRVHPVLELLPQSREEVGIVHKDDLGQEMGR